MVGLDRILLTVTWLCAAASSASGQMVSAPATSATDLKGDITDQQSFGDYLIRIRDLGSMQNSVEILKSGKLIHYQLGQHLSFGCTEEGVPKASRVRVGQDVTGSGNPELVIKNEFSNSYGTSDWYVFALDDELIRVVSVLGVITGEGTCPFHDLNGDGVPEFIVLDPTFAGFRTSHAESPLPKVVLRLSRGWYVPAPDLMKTARPTTALIGQKARSLRESEAWLKGEPPPELGQYLVDLVYEGHADLAKSLLNQAWPTTVDGKKQYWAELRKLLSESRYWTQPRGLPDADLDSRMTGNQQHPSPTAAVMSTPAPNGNVPQSSFSRAQRLLAEQKSRAAAVTAEAARVLTGGEPVSRLLGLYSSRLHELERLRKNTIEDRTLDGSDRERISSAFQGEMESIGRILAQYRELYGK